MLHGVPTTKWFEEKGIFLLSVYEFLLSFAFLGVYCELCSCFSFFSPCCSFGLRVPAVLVSFLSFFLCLDIFMDLVMEGGFLDILIIIGQANEIWHLILARGMYFYSRVCIFLALLFTL